MFRALPDPPAPQGASEPLPHYGARVLAFVLATDCPTVCSTRALESADHAFPWVVSGAYEIATTYDVLARARRAVTDCLRRRRALDAELASAVRLPATPDDRPNLGPMARLQPAPITRPPAPDHAQLMPVALIGW